MISKEDVAAILSSSKEFFAVLDLKIESTSDSREIKKFNEVVGFCEQVVEVVNAYPRDKEIVFLDCSCGKSYLSFTLNYILKMKLALNVFFYGVDHNRALIDKCEQIKGRLGYDNMRFINSKIIDVVPEKQVDIAVALHACDIATDEAIAKGIKCNAKYVIVVPCCENQVKNRLKVGHPLVDLTDYGLLRYRFADILTEGLRARFLAGAGYHVKFLEVTSPKYTPKNLMIVARRKKGNKKNSMDGYKRLDEMFNTKFILKSLFDGCQSSPASCVDVSTCEK